MKQMLLSAALLALSLPVQALPALAQDHAGHAMAKDGPDYMTPMDVMMEDMADMPMTGDPDVDFLLMMIPHHQSAVDMARAELEHGKDAETRAMAEAVIEAQEAEIAQMHEMLTRLGHPLQD